jgi:uncharacterized protein (TIGR02466 family)
MSKNKNEMFLFFPTVIREIQIANAKELNKQIEGGVRNIRETEPNSLPASWSCSLYTTIGSPTTLVDHKEFAPLHRIIVQEADAFANDLDLDIGRFPLKFTECWLNIYSEGHAQEIHQHANAVVSGIYYVKAPPGQRRPSHSLALCRCHARSAGVQTEWPQHQDHANHAERGHDDPVPQLREAQRETDPVQGRAHLDRL